MQMIDKMEKINTYHQKFIERVKSHEIPNFKDWIKKQEEFHNQIREKIQVSLFYSKFQKCQDLYHQYKNSKHKTPIDKLVFKKFEKLTEKYEKDFEIDLTHLHKIEEIIEMF